MDNFNHTSIALAWLAKRTDEVILFYSGGKDSVVLLDMLSPLFKKVYCVYMYFLKDLQHIEPYLTFAQSYKNVTVLQYPHWMTAYYIRNNFYTFARPFDRMKAIKQVDIELKAKRDTGCDWMVFGHKKADSAQRRFMLQNYLFDAIHEKNKKVYPLSHWTKKQVLSYISFKNLPMPVQYGRKNSNGVDLSADVLLWLRTNCPPDYEKILQTFPLAGKLLFDYDYNNNA